MSTTVFLSCKITKKSARKVGLKVCEHLFSNLEKKWPSSQTLPVRKTMFSFYF